MGVLYIGYDSSKSRDDEAVIKQRFGRTLAMCAISPVLLLLFSENNIASAASGACARDVDAPLQAWLGIGFSWSCVFATMASLAMTATLYLGPMVMMDQEDWLDLLSNRLSPNLLNARALLVVSAPAAASLAP